MHIGHHPITTSRHVKHSTHFSIFTIWCISPLHNHSPSKIRKNIGIPGGEDGRNYYWQLFGLYQRPTSEDLRGKFMVYDLGVAAASKSGKPPPESAPRIRATGALQCVQPTHKRGRKSILVTDGAPCYPKLTSEHSLLHEACNHSKGIFCITKKKHWGNLLVHTGGIDGMWKISKGAVSSSWSTRKDGAVNPQLLQGIRIWQWRWHHGNSTDFLSLTGRALSKRLEKWHASEEQGKGFQPATTTKPCKYHDIPSKSFNFPRENLR